MQWLPSTSRGQKATLTRGTASLTLCYLAALPTANASQGFRILRYWMNAFSIFLSNSEEFSCLCFHSVRVVITQILSHVLKAEQLHSDPCLNRTFLLHQTQHMFWRHMICQQSQEVCCQVRARKSGWAGNRGDCKCFLLPVFQFYWTSNKKSLKLLQNPSVIKQDQKQASREDAWGKDLDDGFRNTRKHSLK